MFQEYICQADMFLPSRSSSGPPRTQIQSFCVLEGPEDDLLGRNMSP